MSAPLPFVGLEEAAKIAHAGQSTIRAWISDGKIRAYKPGKSVLVDLASLLAFITSAPIGAAPPVESAPLREEVREVAPTAIEISAAARKARRSRARTERTMPARAPLRTVEGAR